MSNTSSTVAKDVISEEGAEGSYAKRLAGAETTRVTRELGWGSGWGGWRRMPNRTFRILKGQGPGLEG